MRISDWSSDVCSSDLEARNAVGRLRADTEPMVRAIGVELDALLVVLGEKRVVIADPLDEAAVARAARIGDDDAVIGTLLGAAARQTNAECHCVPSSFFYSSPQRRPGSFR